MKEKILPVVSYVGGLSLIILLGIQARAQEGEIPVPRSVTISKDLTRVEAAGLMHAAKMFYAFWNTGKESYLAQAVSRDFNDNTLPEGRPQGYNGIIFASNAFRKAIPDLKCSVEDLVITGDKIACRQIYSGHNTGPMNGMPPSGKEVNFTAIDILHVRNGMVFEDWHLEDNLTLIKQVGAVK